MEHTSPLPARPLERITPAKEEAYRKLAAKLSTHFQFEPEQAQILARIFEDPSYVRQQLDRPLTKRLPGGVASFVEAFVYTGAVAVSPINPRISERRVYPVATPIGEPVRAPLPVEAAPAGLPVLIIDARREQVESQLQWSREVLTQEAVTLREQLEIDGILEPLTVVLAEVRDRGEPSSIYMPIAIDGSTRVAHSHDLINVAEVDVVYHLPQDNRAWRTFLGQRLAVQDRAIEEVTERELVAHRAMVAPARVIIGLRSVRNGEPIDMLTASRSIVGQIHVGHPRDWPQGARLDEIADAILDRLVRDQLITGDERRYLSGTLTLTEAGTYGLPPYPDVRACYITRTLYDTRNARAISAAYRGLVAKQRLGTEDVPLVVAELILRAFRSNLQEGEVANARLTLQRTINLPEWRDVSRWSVPNMSSPDILLERALEELRLGKGELGSSICQLGLMGTYWLITTRSLRSDERDSADRRAGSSVIREMLRSELGLRQLHRAIVEGRNSSRSIPRVTAGGMVEVSTIGDVLPVNNQWLREKFSSQGQRPALSTSTDETSRLNQSIEQVRNNVDILMDTLSKVPRSRVQDCGISPELAEHISSKLRDAVRLIEYWGLIAQARRGQHELFRDDGDIQQPKVTR